MDEKKKYEKPEMELTVFVMEDVVTSSAGLQVDPIGDGDGNKWSDLF